MSQEIYLHHPTFGLLFRVCQLSQGKELFTTIYNQRFFFLVTARSEGIGIELINRISANSLMEKHLRQLRRTGLIQEYNQLMVIYRQIFD